MRDDDDFDESLDQFGVPFVEPVNPIIVARDAEIARLRAEVERLAREEMAVRVEAHKLSNDLATTAKQLGIAHAALAAGPAALRGYGDEEMTARTAAAHVEAAQKKAMGDS